MRPRFMDLQTACSGAEIDAGNAESNASPSVASHGQRGGRRVSILYLRVRIGRYGVGSMDHDGSMEVSGDK